MKNPLLCILLILFSINLFAAPGNDLCSNATTRNPVASCGALTGQTLFQATSSGPSGACGAGTTYDVWYKFTTNTGVSTYTISVSGAGPGITSGNTFIEVFNTTTCGGIATSTSLGCANIGTGLTIGNLSPNALYYFRVYTTTNPTSAAANWIFSICIANALPSNDDCATALVIVPGTTNVAGTVWGATATTGVPAACSGSPNDDVWYKFTAVNSYASVTLSSVGTNLATSGAMLQVFSSTSPCTGLASIGCTAVGVLNLTGLTIGGNYYIRVFSAGGTAINNSGAVFSVSVAPSAPVIVGSGRMMEVYNQTVISAPGILLDPWEVTYGPDGYLWITESKGSRIYRMNPVTGVRDTILNLEQGSTFFAAPEDSFNLAFDIKTIANAPQGGMAGFALHPQFMTMSPKYVYVSYVRKYISTAGGSGGVFYRNMLARFTYNTGTGKLENPESICDSLPGSSDHNSQRLIIASVNNVDYLFYAAGDMGAGQFANQNRTNSAQNVNVYEGKILRYNLNPNLAEPNKYLKWIPATNPIANSAIWCTGIRNNQGFAFDTLRRVLYGASHGPYSDDEINILEKNRNYGHPLVIGYKADENYATSTAGAPNTTSSCPMIGSEVTNANTIGTSYKDPLFSAYARPQSEIHNIWLTNPGNGGWPSEGWSGMEFYSNSIVPGWKNSLVVSSLKWGRILKFKLGVGDTTVIPTDGYDTVSYFGSTNRFRDVSFSPNGKDLYVIMDRSATTSGPSAANPVIPACGGCVQKYTFLGYDVNTGSGNRSYIPTAIHVADGLPTVFEKANKVVINAANGNTNLWVPITDTNSNIVAEINARGRDLDTVTTYLYTKTGTSRVKSSVKYLNRNITISPQKQPGGSVWIRLYIAKTEFNQLVTDGGVGSIGTLKILKNNDSSQAAISSTAAIATTSISEAFDTAYVLQGDINAFGTGAAHAASFYFATSLVTLPVELLTFKGSLQNNATLLQWKTSQETNASHFVVERSIDGVSYGSIGIVAASGNSNTELSYDYLDNDVTTLPATIIYYRLRMVDVNGEYKYSNVISVTLPALTTAISIAPNPVAHEATVKVMATVNGKMQWDLTDNAGHIVLQNSTDLKKGRNTFTIDLSKMAAGIYYLNAKGAGLDEHIKIQKQ